MALRLDDSVLGASIAAHGRYVVESMCSLGSDTVTCKCRDNQTKSQVFVKKTAQLRDDDYVAALRSLHFLRAFKHPCIQSLLNVIMLPSDVDQAHFGDRSNLQLQAKALTEAALEHAQPCDLIYVFELMDMDLYQLIQSGANAFTEEHVQFFLLQLLCALRLLHAAGVAHRNVKASTILINEQCHVRLCGFSLAREVGRGPQQASRARPDVTGVWYQAPEQLLGLCDGGTAVDMWAAGCVFAEMLGHTVPMFPGSSAGDPGPSNAGHQLSVIVRTIGTPEPSFIEQLTPLQASAMAAFGTVPAKPLAQLLPRATPDALDLLGRMLAWDPSKRITAEDALRHPYLHGKYDPNEAMVSQVAPPIERPGLDSSDATASSLEAHPNAAPSVAPIAGRLLIGEAYGHYPGLVTAPVAPSPMPLQSPFPLPASGGGAFPAPPTPHTDRVDASATCAGARAGRQGSEAPKHPFASHLRVMDTVAGPRQYFSLPSIVGDRLAGIPFCVRILLENCVRNAADAVASGIDLASIHAAVAALSALPSLHDDSSLQDGAVSQPIDIPFWPARVLMQDYTGVPALVDVAATRDAVLRLGGDPSAADPRIPVDLVIDHSVQVDVSGKFADAVAANQRREFERNSERFAFLKWAASSLSNVRVIPPGGGIVHQINLEFFARVVRDDGAFVFPDTVIGTDSHTTMVNGVGVLGWGVGGIEAEASMLGVPLSVPLPVVVGVRLSGRLATGATSTDLVLTLTELLRRENVVGMLVEFCGDALDSLHVPDRASLANMAPEYGALAAFFPVDAVTLEYLSATGRDPAQCDLIERYLTSQSMFRTPTTPVPQYSRVISLDLSSVVPCLAGPKSPQDRVPLSDMQRAFRTALMAPVGFAGFGLGESQVGATAEVLLGPCRDLNGDTSSTVDGAGRSGGDAGTRPHVPVRLAHGSVVIAAITSCTNTSHPGVMLMAGILAQRAVAAGLTVPPFVCTSLAPGSKAVTQYLESSGGLAALATLGFGVTGYGCMVCIGTSGPLDPAIEAAVQEKKLVVASVLSGNRNFEGRVHPLTHANYLASPPLVVAYALASRVDIDFATEPIGHTPDGAAVFLADLWPSAEEVGACVKAHVLPQMFAETYATITRGSAEWHALGTPTGPHYDWGVASGSNAVEAISSTYIHPPPFVASVALAPPKVDRVCGARCLLSLGDSITTDHISPAGSIAPTSTAGKWLLAQGISRRDLNTFGARRGHDGVMVRGTFAHPRLMNRLVPGTVGPTTVHLPTATVGDIYDVAMSYARDNTPLVILAGRNYGCGSSRDWAAKGCMLLGVKAVLAVSFERIHRSNLLGMGVAPLAFQAGESVEALGLAGTEVFHIQWPSPLTPRATVLVHTDCGKSFPMTFGAQTTLEVLQFEHGGVLPFIVRRLCAKATE